MISRLHSHSKSSSVNKPLSYFTCLSSRIFSSSPFYLNSISFHTSYSSSIKSISCNTSSNVRQSYTRTVASGTPLFDAISRENNKRFYSNYSASILENKSLPMFSFPSKVKVSCTLGGFLFNSSLSTYTKHNSRSHFCIAPNNVRTRASIQSLEAPISRFISSTPSHFFSSSSLSLNKNTLPEEGNAAKEGSNATETTLQTISPPKPFSPILLLPINRRPLFPGFYKTVVVKDPEVIKAIKDIGRSTHPYVTAVLIKNDEADMDQVESLNDIHRVGVFCQITNYFTHVDDPNSLTIVLYPHQRVRILSLSPKPELVTSTENEASLTPDVESTSTSISSSSSSLPPTPPSQKEEEEEKKVSTPFMSAYSSLLQKYQLTSAMTEPMQDEQYKRDNQLIRALTSEIVSVLKDIATLNPIFRDQITAFSISHASASIFDDPSKLADFAAAVSGGSHSDELQSVLDSIVIEERLQKALYVLKKELVNAQLQSKLSKEIESKIQKRQREYYLMEQLKSIKKELGLESDGKDKLIEKFKSKLQKLTLPDQVSTVVEEELQKLSHLDPTASEFNVTRNYLDWLTSLPWGQVSQEQLDVHRAQTILDEDHYGLKEVKERILEFIAVGKLKGSVQGKILCFVGPPGVGKTSIGKSIARALNRPFYRFSVGGLSDVAEIKGHRRTYIGAMPGKLVQAMKKVQSENPFILIDEIDKLGRGVHGDPASALLELLDPEQNAQFLDHYLDIPMDLSKVLFVCTANLTDTIPGPLLDRMEVIQLSGYIADEKKAIASKYLVPQAKVACGLEKENVQLEDSAIEYLIRSYCRESGVRNLKKHIEKVFRKAAFQLVNQPTPIPSTTKDGIQINATNLKDFVGSAPFSSDRIFDITPPGVVMGLAWTALGGSALYIECVVESKHIVKEGKVVKGGGGGSSFFQKTGKLGEVMQESATLAYTFARTFYEKKFPESDFFDTHRIHLHVPEGATPKDGPSAGITMATSILSLAMNHKVTADIAMTGELTLSGKVLKIGGLKEKAIAAKRSGVKTIVFPKANESDWIELPDIVKEGLEPIMVEWYDEVFDACFKKETKEV